MATLQKGRNDEDVLLHQGDATAATGQKHLNGEGDLTALERSATLADFTTQN